MLLTNADYELASGASVNTVTLGTTVSTAIDATTTNTATWTAFTDPGVPFSATASATVTVAGAYDHRGGSRDDGAQVHGLMFTNRTLT